MRITTPPPPCLETDNSNNRHLFSPGEIDLALECLSSKEFWHYRHKCGLTCSWTNIAKKLNQQFNMNRTARAVQKFFTPHSIRHLREMAKDDMLTSPNPYPHPHRKNKPLARPSCKKTNTSTTTKKSKKVTFQEAAFSPRTAAAFKSMRRQAIRLCLVDDTFALTTHPRSFSPYSPADLAQDLEMKPRITVLSTIAAWEACHRESGSENLKDFAGIVVAHDEGTLGVIV